MSGESRGPSCYSPKADRACSSTSSSPSASSRSPSVTRLPSPSCAVRDRVPRGVPRRSARAQRRAAPATAGRRSRGLAWPPTWPRSPRSGTAFRGAARRRRGVRGVVNSSYRVSRSRPRMPPRRSKIRSKRRSGVHALSPVMASASEPAGTPGLNSGHGLFANAGLESSGPFQHIAGLPARSAHWMSPGAAISLQLTAHRPPLACGNGFHE